MPKLQLSPRWQERNGRHIFLYGLLSDGRPVVVIIDNWKDAQYTVVLDKETDYEEEYRVYARWVQGQGVRPRFDPIETAIWEMRPFFKEVAQIQVG